MFFTKTVETGQGGGIPALKVVFGRFCGGLSGRREKQDKRLASQAPPQPPLLPAVRAVDGGFSAVGCGASCERFQSGWRLSSRKRRCPKEFSGALWPFRKEIEVITSSKTGSARQACFESPQSMKRDFQAFKNRTAVTKEERLRQRKNCAAIDKD